MSIAISISPGTVLQEGERVSTAKLNKLGTPTAAGTAALNDLDDVAIINPVSGQLLGYNGSEDRWEPTATLPEGSNPEMIGSVYGGTGHVYDYNVNTTSHIITTTAAIDASWITGRPCTITLLSGSFVPAPLAEATTYYLIRLTDTTVKLATSATNALAGTAITLINQGSGTFGINCTETQGVAGIVPASTVASRLKFLRGDGSWATEATLTGATSSVAGALGLAPAPSAGDQAKFLRGDATWTTVPGAALYARWTANQAAVTTVTIPTASNDTWGCTKPSDWVDGTIYPIIFRATGAGTWPSGYFDNTPANVVTLVHTSVYWALHLTGGDFLLFDSYAKAVANAGAQFVTDSVGTPVTLHLSWLPLLKARGVTGVVRSPAATASTAFTAGQYRIILESTATDTAYLVVAMVKPTSTTPGHANVDDSAVESTGQCYVETFPYNSATATDMASVSAIILGI